jgi:hypothetical protein
MQGCILVVLGVLVLQAAALSITPSGTKTSTQTPLHMAISKIICLDAPVNLIGESRHCYSNDFASKARDVVELLLEPLVLWTWAPGLAFWPPHIHIHSAFLLLLTMALRSAFRLGAWSSGQQHDEVCGLSWTYQYPCLRLLDQWLVRVGFGMQPSEPHFYTRLYAASCRLALIRGRRGNVGVGDQFGVSFSNNTVANAADFNTAVAELRAWTASGQDFFPWLLADKEVNWQTFLDKLQTTYDTSTLLRKFSRLL